MGERGTASEDMVKRTRVEGGSTVPSQPVHSCPDRIRVALNSALLPDLPHRGQCILMAVTVLPGVGVSMGTVTKSVPRGVRLDPS